MAVCGVTTTVATAANADGAAQATPRPPAGQAALERARASWEKGDYDVAEPLYAEALEKGGLAPTDVLEAYVHLGSARAVLGKRAGALAAFKTAAQLDPHFSVPAEAGKRAAASASQARKLEAKVGPVLLHADIPTEMSAGDTAKIDVTLDPSHAAIPSTRLGVYAVSSATGADHTASVRAEKRAHFELPRELSLSSTTLDVRVDWLDVHANRLATAEEQVHVLPQAQPAPSLPLVALAPTDDASHAAAAKDHRDTGGGFWHSAWPYIIGGAALAAGGAAIYLATRSSDDVNVTGARVVTN